jgi:hypothetical protein
MALFGASISVALESQNETAPSDGEMGFADLGFAERLHHLMRKKAANKVESLRLAGGLSTMSRIQRNRSKAHALAESSIRCVTFGSVHLRLPRGNFALRVEFDNSGIVYMLYQMTLAHILRLVAGNLIVR